MNGKPTFEEKMEELETLLAKMQAPDTGLEETIGLYARCAGLVKECRAILYTAQLKVDEIDKAMGESEAQ